MCTLLPDDQLCNGSVKAFSQTLYFQLCFLQLSGQVLYMQTTQSWHQAGVCDHCQEVPHALHLKATLLKYSLQRGQLLHG